MTSWPRVRMGDLATLITKGTTPTTLGLPLAPQGIQLLRAQNVNFGQLLRDVAPVFISEDVHNELKRSQIIPGDLLITIAGTIGRACVVPDDAPLLNSNQAVAIIRLNRSINRNFLRHWLASDEAQDQIVGRQVTATITNLSLSQIANLSVPLPPKDHQKRIAAILDAAESLREKRRRAIETYGQLDEALFGQLVERVSAEKAIADLCDEIYRYPSYYDITYESEGVPEIRGELILSDGTLSLDRAQLRFITPETSRRFPRTVLRAGDLVMSVRGTVGKVAAVPQQLDGANITANLMRIAPDRTKVTPVYLLHVLRSALFGSRVQNACSSTTIATIKASDLKQIKIPLPSMKQQEKFGNEIAAVSRTRGRAGESQKPLADLVESLQHRAFRGEL